MVCIVSFTNRIETPFDRHDYELRVNQKAISIFENQREDGLPVCLRRAVEAGQNATTTQVGEVLAEPGNVK
jgi:hypothetical protein